MMYRSLERSPQDSRDGIFLYSAQASFSWPRVDLARLLRRAYSWMVFLPHTNTVILLEPYCGTITEPGLPVVLETLVKANHNNKLVRVSEG